MIKANRQLSKDSNCIKSNLQYKTGVFLEVHSFRLCTEKGQHRFWERHISMICLCSKYVKNCNIFGQILNIWVKLILKKNFNFFFQCLALPKDSQSFVSQNLRCPFLVSQYYRRRRLWDMCIFVPLQNEQWHFFYIDWLKLYHLRLFGCHWVVDFYQLWLHIICKGLY